MSSIKFSLSKVDDGTLMLSIRQGNMTSLVYLDGEDVDHLIITLKEAGF